MLNGRERERKEEKERERKRQRENVLVYEKVEADSMDYYCRIYFFGESGSRLDFDQ